jgi:hypothetical protein
MIYFIREGKFFTEGDKAVPFKDLAGLVIIKATPIKTGKNKGAIKVELDKLKVYANPELQPWFDKEEPEKSNSPIVVATEMPDEPRSAYSELVITQTTQQSPTEVTEGENRREARRENFRAPKGPNKFLQMNVDVPREKENFRPAPRDRPPVPTELFPVVCHVCQRTYKAPYSELPATIEGEQMQGRCPDCYKR